MVTLPIKPHIPSLWPPYQLPNLRASTLGVVMGNICYQIHCTWLVYVFGYNITFQIKWTLCLYSGEHLAQWDSPMRVKLSLWKPHLKTLLIELLPWALLINQSRWDLWLFEGENIVLQIPAGKTIIPPNFKVIVCSHWNICIIQINGYV